MTLCNENAPILVNEEMGCNIWLMTVRAPEIASTARPGQFVHVKVPGMEAHILRRPFGVYAADAEAGTVDMMYQVLGFGTEHMTELAIVDTVEMIGPIGRGWQPPEGCKRALIVAGGVGSAPLYPLVEELTAAGVATDAILGATAMVNVSGHSFDEYVAVIGALEEAPVAAYEVTISCPNVDAGGMTMGCHVPSVEKVVSLCRAATKRPLIVKLTPNVTDITEIAKAAEAAGADGISLINTLLGMAVDARTRRPKLARVVGGYSGPAVKPVALRMVWQVSQAVSVPVLGMGGIATGEDAVEFMLAGATAVAVGTANFVNPTATVDVIDGIIDYCESQGVKDVNELIGALQC